MLLGRWACIDGVDAVPFTSITINKDYNAGRHSDENNAGPSLVRALDNFQGGDLLYWHDDRHGTGLMSVGRFGSGKVRYGRNDPMTARIFNKHLEDPKCNIKHKSNKRNNCLLSEWCLPGGQNDHTPRTSILHTSRSLDPLT
jgi:hypothetical protein